MTKVLRGLEKRPTFEELIGTGGSDISDIGLYTRQPATKYRNFFFATQGDGVELDETLDDKVSKILTMLQMQVEVEKQKTIDRQEDARRQFNGHLPNSNNESEMGTGSIPSSNASFHASGFDGSPPPLPPPTEPPGFPPGPVAALPLPPEPSFFNAPRRAAREQVERGRSPPRPTPGEGAPPPIGQPLAQPAAALRQAPSVPDSSGSASTRPSTRRSVATSSSSSSSGGYSQISNTQLQSRGRATVAVMQRNPRNPLNASAPPAPKAAARRRRTRMDTPEGRRYLPYSGNFA